MKSKLYHQINRIAFVLVIVIMPSLLTVQVAWADMGPKPSMEFKFRYETDEPLTIIEGTQHECKYLACSDERPLAEDGPQRFTCKDNRCSSLAYKYSPYHYLSIHFSDGVTRKSNVFAKSHHSAIYRVTVRENDLLVKETGGRYNGFAILPLVVLGGAGALLLGYFFFAGGLVMLLNVVAKSKLVFDDSKRVFIAIWVLMLPLIVLGGYYYPTLLVTLVIEGLVALVYAELRKFCHVTLVTFVVLFNLFTQPLLWLLARTQGFLSLVFLEFLYLAGAPVGKIVESTTEFPHGDLVIAEIVIWLMEAILLRLALRKTISFWEALGLSFILNASSFLVGLLLPL